MGKFNSIVNSLSYESVNILYSANNINYDKSVLFSDYIQSLLILVFDTYMGDEYMTRKDRLDHFKWCWDRNIRNFSKENIVFYDYKESYDYFLGFLEETFYNIDSKDDNEHIISYKKYLNKVFFKYYKDYYTSMPLNYIGRISLKTNIDKIKIFGILIGATGLSIAIPVLVHKLIM